MRKPIAALSVLLATAGGVCLAPAAGAAPADTYTVTAPCVGERAVVSLTAAPHAGGGTEATATVRKAKSRTWTGLVALMEPRSTGQGTEPKEFVTSGGSFTTSAVGGGSGAETVVASFTATGLDLAVCTAVAGWSRRGAVLAGSGSLTLAVQRSGVKVMVGSLLADPEETYRVSVALRGRGDGVQRRVVTGTNLEPASIADFRHARRFTSIRVVARHLASGTSDHLVLRRSR